MLNWLVFGVAISCVGFGAMFMIIDKDIGWYSISKGQILVVILIAIVLTIIFIISLVFPLIWYSQEKEEDVCEILSLERTTIEEANGVFILGIGSANSHTEQTYYYYAKTSKGARLEEIYQPYIIEDSDIIPHMVKKKDKNSFIEYYVIYVPQGTIIKEFRG